MEAKEEPSDAAATPPVSFEGPYNPFAPATQVAYRVCNRQILSV